MNIRKTIKKYAEKDLKRKVTNIEVTKIYKAGADNYNKSIKQIKRKVK